MQMYLKSDSDIFRFPVIPPSINVQDYAVVNDSNITMLGDIVIYGGEGLKSTEMTSFFPNSDRGYKFVDYTDYPAPWECVNTITSWLREGKILRFIVTDTDINFECIITNFEYSQQDGTGDVYFTIRLQEYRAVKLTTSSSSTTNKTTGNKDRADTSKTSTSKTTSNKTSSTTTKNSTKKQTTYTVKSGDTLWDIAKQQYGSGSDYTKIVSKNKEKYPSLSKNTIIEVGWELTL